MDKIGASTVEGQDGRQTTVWRLVLRILAWTLACVAALLVVLLTAMVVSGGPLIKGAINRVGPLALGVPVSVKDVTFRPLQGLIRLRGLHVGNPEGFKTPSLFDLQEVTVQLKPVSLLAGPVHITGILVKDPVITYELALGKSNIGVLTDSMAGKEPAKDPDETSDAKKGNVVVDELVIDGARVKLSATLLGGVAAPIPLPRIVVRNIGKADGGTSYLEVTRAALSAVGSAVVGSVVGVAGGLVGGVKAVGRGIGSLFSGEGTSNAVPTNAIPAGDAAQ